MGVRPPGKKGQKILSFHAHHYTMSEHQRLTERFLELLGWGWGIGQTYIKELDVGHQTSHSQHGTLPDSEAMPSKF